MEVVASMLAARVASFQIKRIGGRGSLWHNNRLGGFFKDGHGRILLSTCTNGDNGNNNNNHNHSIRSRVNDNNDRSVLVVGMGLTGAICCHLIRRGNANVRIEAIDMARGAGGRMSTTRRRMHNKEEIKANTGAQYASCFTKEAKSTLIDVCEQKEHELHIFEEMNPMKRSLHFLLNDENEYAHYSIPGGTNNLVKQFLYSGKPDIVSFETRLLKLWKNNSNKIIPEFDLQRGRGGKVNPAR